MFIKVLVLLLAHENEHSNIIKMLRFSTSYEYHLCAKLLISIEGSRAVVAVNLFLCNNS